MKDEDDQVNDQCGTESWIAPEIQRKSMMYSPIKADQWSCRHFVLRLLDELWKEDDLLIASTGKLMTHGPNERASLFEWRKWSVNPQSLSVANVRTVMRRKASAFPNIRDTRRWRGLWCARFLDLESWQLAHMYSRHT